MAGAAPPRGGHGQAWFRAAQLSRVALATLFENTKNTEKTQTKMIKEFDEFEGQEKIKKEKKEHGGSPKKAEKNDKRKNDQKRIREKWRWAPRSVYGGWCFWRFFGLNPSWSTPSSTKVARHVFLPQPFTCGRLVEIDQHGLPCTLKLAKRFNGMLPIQLVDKSRSKVVPNLGDSRRHSSSGSR